LELVTVHWELRKCCVSVMARYVLKAEKRVFGIPDFYYYCIADGLTSGTARRRMKEVKDAHTQRT
jgi:hypothetical protein